LGAVLGIIKRAKIDMHPKSWTLLELQLYGISKIIYMRLCVLCCATIISLFLEGCSYSNISDEFSVPKSSARIFLKEELE